MIETTFAMIKPDAIRDGHMVSILQEIERHGFVMTDIMMMRLSREVREEFYAEHKEREFFGELIDFMGSGSVVALTLRRENAVAHWRFVMGATDPKKAAPGTIRNLWGSKTGPIMWNCVHGSDSAKSARREIGIIQAQEALFGVEALDSFPVPESEYGVHAAHCCRVHGCKYESQESPRCPVMLGKIEREHDAGWCQEPGLVEDPAECRREGERRPRPDYRD